MNTPHLVLYHSKLGSHPSWPASSRLVRFGEEPPDSPGVLVILGNKAIAQISNLELNLEGLHDDGIPGGGHTIFLKGHRLERRLYQTTVLPTQHITASTAFYATAICLG